MVGMLQQSDEGFNSALVLEHLKYGFPSLGKFPSSGLYAGSVFAEDPKLDKEELR